MDKTTFCQIGEKEYSLIPLAGTNEIKFKIHQAASWAVWDPGKPGNAGDYINNRSDELNPAIVFVLLNFAGANDNGPFAFAQDWKPWNNFHADKPSPMIRRLYKKLNNSPYRGAYMTDIIKCVPSPNENTLRQMIKNGRVNMNAQMELFIDEILNLNVDSIKLYLMGRTAKWVFDNYLEKNAKFQLIKDKILFSGQTYHPNAHVTDDKFYESITKLKL